MNGLTPTQAVQIIIAHLHHPAVLFLEVVTCRDSCPLLMLIVKHLVAGVIVSIMAHVAGLVKMIIHGKRKQVNTFAFYIHTVKMKTK